MMNLRKRKILLQKRSRNLIGMEIQMTASIKQLRSQHPRRSKAKQLEQDLLFSSLLSSQEP